MNLMTRSLLLVATFLVCNDALSREVPVADFFKDPEFTSVSLSPSGEYITVSVPQGDRTVLAAFRIDGMELVGKWDYGKERHIDRVLWVNDERFLLFVTRKLGSFDYRVGTPDVYASNVDGRRRTDIPNGGTYQLVNMLWDDPEHVLVSRSVDTAFLFRMNVYDGETHPVATAPIRFGTFLVDHDNNVRYAVGAEQNNDSVTLRRDGDAWTEVHRDAMGGSVRRPLGFAPDNRRVYFAVSENGEPARIVLIDPQTRDQDLVISNPNVVPSGYLSSADERHLLAVGYADGLPAYEFIDTEHEESKAYAGLIQAFPQHAVAFGGISRDGRFILVRTYSDIDPGRYYLFDRESGEARFLLAARSWIKPEEMSPKRPIVVTARDGVTLHGYLTVPRGSDGRDLPLILHPHGGPHGPRDMWGFEPIVQFLASRGYAVLQINFRGSGGYGNAFERMGYRNWGTTMIDDMTDAVRWTVEQGIADPDRICTFGASYGGYAALQTVVREPDLYRCTIGYVGVYSLPLMFRDGDIPDSVSGRNYLRRVLPESKEEQERQSAAFNVDRIRIPVMLVHGDKDMRVPMSQYRALKRELERAGRPPEVEVIERKEGHGFYDLDNNVRLYTEIEKFLDRHIGEKRRVASH